LFTDIVRYASGSLRYISTTLNDHARDDVFTRNVVTVFLVALFFLITPAYPQTVPYIEDMVGEDGIENTDFGERTGDDNRLRLIGTFKLFNPDTVPFYIWITFENGGMFKHTRYRDEYPAVRLVDLELRYKDALQRPMVKKFPNRADLVPRSKKRFGGSWLGGGRASSGKKVSRSRRGVVDAGDVYVGGDDVDAGVVADASEADRGGRAGRGASEITFWKEDAQAYYEMELWGALYAPDVRGAVVAGNYVENIKFEIEPVR